MTDRSSVAPKLSAQDKAERTSQAAATIMNEERRASDAKVARLKALRLAREPAPEAVPASLKGPSASGAAKKVKASSLRRLALSDSPPAARRRAT